MTTPFIVGIPTLRRYDCLEKCLGHLLHESTVHPQKVVVIDNGGKLKSSLASWPTAAAYYAGGTLDIVTPQENLGVSSSWNMLHRLTRPTMLVLVNDDIYVGKNTLELLTRPPGPCIVTALGWSCFRQDHSVWDTVGDYDEAIYPSYCEDNDYDRRRTLAGCQRVIMENDTDPIGHTRSATIAVFNEEEKAVFAAQYAKICRYYTHKWGGMPGHETQTVPFGGLSVEMRAELSKEWKLPR